MYCVYLTPSDWEPQSKLLPKAKLVNNHLLIDPAAAVFDRTDEEYQPLRQALVSDKPRQCTKVELFTPLQPPNSDHFR